MACPDDVVYDAPNGLFNVGDRKMKTDHETKLSSSPRDYHASDCSADGTHCCSKSQLDLHPTLLVFCAGDDGDVMMMMMILKVRHVFRWHSDRGRLFPDPRLLHWGMRATGAPRGGHRVEGEPTCLHSRVNPCMCTMDDKAYIIYTGILHPRCARCVTVSHHSQVNADQLSLIVTQVK